MAHYLEFHKFSSYKGNDILFKDVDLKVYEKECIGIQANREVQNVIIEKIIEQDEVIIPADHSIFVLDSRIAPYQSMKLAHYIDYMLSWHDSAEQKEDILRLLKLQQSANKKISKINEQELQRLRYLSLYLTRANICLLQEPLQNTDYETQHVLKHIISLLIEHTDKMMIVLSNNSAELEQCSEPVYILNEQGAGKIRNQLPEKESRKEENVKISCRHGDRIIIFSTEEISFIESENAAVMIYAQGNKYKIDYTLKELEGILNPDLFFRPHRSYFVNLEEISELICWSKNSYSIQLKNVEDILVPVSKANIPALKQKLNI